MTDDDVSSKFVLLSGNMGQSAIYLLLIKFIAQKQTDALQHWVYTLIFCTLTLRGTHLYESDFDRPRRPHPMSPADYLIMQGRIFDALQNE